MRGAAVPGLAGLIMGGTGLADIYKEWQRQHGGG
jgi:hypothetical protein